MRGFGDAERHSREHDLVLPSQLGDLDAMLLANHALCLRRAR